MSDYRHVIQAIGAAERTSFDDLKAITGLQHNSLRGLLNALKKRKFIEKYCGEYELTDLGNRFYKEAGATQMDQFVLCQAVGHIDSGRLLVGGKKICAFCSTRY